VEVEARVSGPRLRCIFFFATNAARHVAFAKMTTRFGGQIWAIFLPTKSHAITLSSQSGGQITHPLFSCLRYLWASDKGKRGSSDFVGLKNVVF
jgi:hypothetical protein